MAEDTELRVIVAEVAAAYFSNSHVPPAEIPEVVARIAASLGAVGAAQTATAPSDTAAESQKQLTSAQIRKSIGQDALISFEDGKPYKTLRRHLAVRGLTPDQYRAKWGLPSDYPMVAPSYSETRARLALAAGLGARSAPDQAPALDAAPAATPAQADGGKTTRSRSERKPSGRKTRSEPSS